MVRKSFVLILSLLAVLAAAGLARAEPLFGGARGPLLRPGAALVEVSAPAGAAAGGSLFAGRARAGLFAPVARRPVAGRAALPGPFASAAERIRHLIARAEAGKRGYDAVQHGARIKPPRRPTAMTIGDIYDWIDATPGQPHAIGRYQFIPATLRRLVATLGLGERTRFSPAVQDRLADLLLDEAGLAQMTRGQLSRTGFMNNLAKIWAGFPNSSGRSHYHGYAGNHATMSWAQFDAAMREIFPG
ncbi:lysozyme family protein [Roseivivax sediminis]|uniref:Muramidase (Phage lambda lysozyme) n=1 Tax=Roseivivax sediminis TaxID=936889 RepID=A0A1I1SB21_9RHOB|nr:glycoside hydrolase family 104 protein [Roseivivax sediminis]SFD43617.1 hypothetical protein SAMN04515678_10168 [Roseivivax sediminis]